MRINHNISAQLTNVSLKKVDNKVSASLERLSTGYKINKAADDSAGMAISNKMRTQIRALDQASRNSADGDSIIQTAEGAMSEIENILQRIRELGVQAANGTLALEDRKAVQDEVDELMDEVDRIADTTQFNGKGLLDGSASRTVMTNTLSIHAISASMDVPRNDYEITIDAMPEAAKAQLDYTIPSTISINGYSLEITDEYDDTSVRKKIIDMCDAMNIDVSGPDGSLTLTTRATGANQKISVRSAGANDETVIYGKDAKITLGTQFTPADGFSYRASGIVRVEDAGYMVLQIGANEHQTLEMDFKEVSCQSLFLRNKEGVNQINACTQEGATELLKVLDDAIDKISAARSTLGAYQNRLDATRESLDVSEENLTDAMSRIMDTDMASEMTEYTSNNVLSQAATSMLSQANNRPQQIMSLLQS